MEKRTGGAAWYLMLTVPIVVLLAVAAGGGLFVGGLYRDSPNLVAQAVGQDAVTLTVALPTLAISGFLASRGSQRARLVWLGGLIYTVYTYVGYAFAVRFNPLFLVYVALLGCSTYALIGGLVATDMAGIKAAFTGRTPVKAVSIFLGVIAVLTFRVLLTLAILAMVVMEARIGQQNVIPQAVFFVLVLTFGLALLIRFLMNLKS
jgi:hypothetical protein